MAYRAALLSFSKGEISPEVESRFDLGAYQAGLRQALNVRVRRVGGVAKRMGTRFVAEAKPDSRLFTFQFNATQAYVLEFAQAVMRPIALGGVILEDGLCVTAITREAQAKITAAYHGYSVGDPVYLTGQQGMTEINDRFLEVVAVVDANNFRVNFDSTAAGTWTGDSVCITRSAPPAPPPTPPVVPPPEPTPEPPPTTGGGGTEPFCVTSDTLIMLADGQQIEARHLSAGTMLRTFHEETMHLGDYPVSAIAFAEEEVWKAAGYPRATPDHRFYIGGQWVTMREIGEPDGRAEVAKITVDQAHTYISAGVLSHNIKRYDYYTGVGF